MCESCHVSLLSEASPSCPVCRVNLGNHRSLIAEKILCKLPLTQCSFNHKCNFAKADVATVQRHETVCTYRLALDLYRKYF